MYIMKNFACVQWNITIIPIYLIVWKIFNITTTKNLNVLPSGTQFARTRHIQFSHQDMIFKPKKKTKISSHPNLEREREREKRQNAKGTESKNAIKLGTNLHVGAIAPNSSFISRVRKFSKFFPVSPYGSKLTRKFGEENFAPSPAPIFRRFGKFVPRHVRGVTFLWNFARPLHSRYGRSSARDVHSSKIFFNFSPM